MFYICLHFPFYYFSHSFLFLFLFLFLFQSFFLTKAINGDKIVCKCAKVIIKICKKCNVYYIHRIFSFSILFLLFYFSLPNKIEKYSVNILSIEILKIYYIKTYKQLIIVSALVLLKLTVNYFLTLDINDAQKKRSFYSKFVSHGGNGN